MTTIQQEIITSKKLEVLAISQSTKRRNTENVLATDNQFDYLITHTGDIGIFDVRNAVRTEIVKRFEQGYKFYFSQHTSNGFSLRHPTTNERPYDLRQLIAAKKYGKRKIETIKKSRVNHLNNDKTDLTDINIELISEPNKGSNQINDFYIEGKKIVITYKKSGEKFFTNISEELMVILRKQRWLESPYGHLITRYGKLRWNFDLSAFVFGFFYMEMTRTTVTSTLKKIQKLMREDFVIDHLNDAPKNNMFWNVSMMTKSENSAKSNILSKMGLPFVFNGIHIGDGRYRFVKAHALSERKIGDAIEVESDGEIYEFDSPGEMISYLQYWFENYRINGISPKDNYEAKMQNDENIVRYEITHEYYERLKNAVNVINPPQLDKLTRKHYENMVKRSSPEAQENFSLIKPVPGSKIYLIDNTEAYKTEDSNR